jgi:hypothetical protein
MEEIITAASENKILAILIFLAVLFVTYRLVKGIVRTVIVALILVLAIGGYLYFKDPQNRPENLRDAMNKIKACAATTVKKGESAYRKSRDLVQKGKDSCGKTEQMVKKGKETLGKEIEKGKDKTSDLLKAFKKNSND